MSISPNSGADRYDVHVLEQARHQARHDNEHACGSGLSNERDNVIGFLAFNGQRQIFAVPKQIWLAVGASTEFSRSNTT